MLVKVKLFFLISFSQGSWWWSIGRIFMMYLPIRCFLFFKVSNCFFKLFFCNIDFSFCRKKFDTSICSSRHCLLAWFALEIPGIFLTALLVSLGSCILVRGLEIIHFLLILLLIFQQHSFCLFSLFFLPSCI